MLSHGEGNEKKPKMKGEDNGKQTKRTDHLG
jgi:hypothetical protein